MNTPIPLHTKALTQGPLPCQLLARFILLGLIAVVGSAVAQGVHAQADGGYGNNNTAEGDNALVEIIARGGSGRDYTAIGYGALGFDSTGSQNTALGSQAMGPNPTDHLITGNQNTATGLQALYSDEDGGGNVANGWLALYSNTNGAYNTGVGTSALRLNTVGNQNTATGTNALYHSTGNNNTALGFAAGQNLTTGSNNIIIGAGLLGASGDANVTRIGNTTQKKTFIGGIYNIAEPVASGIKPVYINSNGQLGTTPPASSARSKETIKPKDKASEGILSLRPVTFRYKNDGEKTPQFGLIAEEEAKENRDLV